MAALVIAEHNNAEIKAATFNTVAAAAALGDKIDVLVAGAGCGMAAEQAAAIPGIRKVLCADNVALKHQLAENLGPLIASLAEGYDHVLAPSDTFGKNVMPRVAAHLNVQQISDIITVEDADTFKRPVYAGNAIATVRSSDPIKLITVRTTAFKAAEGSGQMSRGDVKR